MRPDGSGTRISGCAVKVFRSTIAGPVRFDRVADVLLSTRDGEVKDEMENCGVPGAALCNRDRIAALVAGRVGAAAVATRTFLALCGVRKR